MLHRNSGKKANREFLPKLSGELSIAWAIMELDLAPLHILP